MLIKIILIFNLIFNTCDTCSNILKDFVIKINVNSINLLNLDNSYYIEPYSIIYSDDIFKMFVINSYAIL